MTGKNPINMNSDLSAYGPEERAHIVRLGIFLHEQGREFWSHHLTPASLSDEFAATNLKEELDRARERLHAVREEEFKKGERRA